MHPTWMSRLGNNVQNGAQPPWSAKLPTWEPYPRSDGLMEPRDITEFPCKPVDSKKEDSWGALVLG